MLFFCIFMFVLCNRIKKTALFHGAAIYCLTSDESRGGFIFLPWRDWLFVVDFCDYRGICFGHADFISVTFHAAKGLTDFIMKVIIHSSSVSPHQAPLILALSKLVTRGAAEMLYTGKPADPFRATGVHHKVAHLVRHWEDSVQDWKEMDEADVIMENHRDFNLLDRLSQTGKLILHPSERWFKPESVPFFPVPIPGFVKMLFPFAWKRARRIVRLLKGENRFYYLPMGLPAAQDMARLCGLLNGEWRCLFRAPRLTYENKPGGRIHTANGRDALYCLDKMRMWGYFVFPSELKQPVVPSGKAGRHQVLWVGRFLRWKRVDDLIRAVSGLSDFDLDLYGAGPDEKRLRELARGMDNVHFKGLVPLAEVRQLMRSHDIYALSSSAYEGWGAVVNEALEEQMRVIGTIEAGSSGTILPDSNLYHAGDWRALRRLLQAGVPSVPIGAWSVESAAKALINWK